MVATENYEFEELYSRNMTVLQTSPSNLKWTIRNTFLEITVPQDQEEHILKRSSSDSCLISPANQELLFSPRFLEGGCNDVEQAKRPSTGTTSAEMAMIIAPLTAGNIAPLKAGHISHPQFKHARVDTRGSTDSTQTPHSSCEDDGGIENPKMQCNDAIDDPQDKPRSDQTIFPRSYPNIPAGNVESNLVLTPRCCFDMAEAVEFYKHLTEVSAQGVDVREAFGHVDLDKYLPVDDQGNQMSVGSIAHLIHPCSKECKPCSCYPRGKCYGGKLCMHCHFYHPLKERNRPDVVKKRRAARSRETASQNGKSSP